jgi:nicotine blue oxidoreductase
MSEATHDMLAGLGIIVLAAGEGRRLGLGPKAHVRLGGATFLERVVRTCRDAEISGIWVVGSPTDARMATACAALAVRLAINAQPELGMSSSVQVGLRAAHADCPRGVFVFPVDHPLVRVSTLDALAAALDDDACVRPRSAGQHGHPILLGAAVVARLIAVERREPLRDALARVAPRFVDVPCDDDATVQGVNTPAELELARAAT